MSKDSGQMPQPPLPWTFPVAVAHLPESGLQQTLETSAAVRDEIAALASLVAVKSATASFTVTSAPGGRVNVHGRVKAHVVQSCVVTLEPVENDIDEPIEVEFAPPAQVAALSKSIRKDEGEDAESPDLPEPIVNGMVDLGQLASEFLVLGLDPYPRKPDVVFEPPAVPENPDDHPFAALKALKSVPAGSKAKTSKDD